ncbi:hypothetical protein DV735_g827, partial [Chaetothyriales sp. CBS 134920]
MMSDPLPDYYAILDVTTTASDIEIKTAYKKAALKWHPDRVPVDSPERGKRTKKFQAINDAYFTLSDPRRRREYDQAWHFHNNNNNNNDDDDDDDSKPADNEGETTEEADEEIPRPDAKPSAGSASAGAFFNWFTGGGRQQQQHHADADAQFGRAFEEMMADDLTEDGDGDGETRRPNARFWAIAGTLSGAVLGFIVANVPGAAAGGAVGNRLGALRDKHRQSVYETFQQLPQTERNKLLTELAAKLFASALSG